MVFQNLATYKINTFKIWSPTFTSPFVSTIPPTMMQDMKTPTLSCPPVILNPKPASVRGETVDALQIQNYHYSHTKFKYCGNMILHSYFGICGVAS